MKHKAVKDIIAQYLEDNGYDGLYHNCDPDGCACMMDDLMPCAGYGCSDNCSPGYKVAEDADESGSFRMVARKPRRKKK